MDEKINSKGQEGSPDANTLTHHRILTKRYTMRHTPSNQLAQRILHDLGQQKNAVRNLPSKIKSI
jgi:hypothetical protein